MKLFLCEKPSQAREIAPHVGARKRGQGCMVGDGVTVTWAIGHLVELAKPDHYDPALKSWDITRLPVLPDDWAVIAKESTRDQFAAVSKLIRGASEIVIATDADREGEVIARELMQLNGYRGKVARLWLSAFDDASINKALSKLLPGEKTLTMYHSGMGRGRADWLAGMNLTMALTKAFGTGGKEGTLHCGRVQTPVLALIVRRERAIAAFKPITHYQLTAQFDLSRQAVPMNWLPDESLLNKDGLILDKASVEAVASKVRGRSGRVVSVETKAERELAPLLFSLGSLQREASARFGMKAQAVLDAAQGLYEKHKATTYPRTDCEYLPTSMLGEAGQVMDAVGRANPELADAVRSAKQGLNAGRSGRAFNDAKVTAHHAIIPTLHPDVDRSAMSREERTVYDMVCRRYLGQFLGEYEYLKTTILLGCEGERFRATGKTPQVLGWRVLDPERPKKSSGDDEPQEPVTLPEVAEGAPALNLSCELAVRKTQPPKRYTEGTLLAAMESIDKEIDDPRLKAVMKNKEKAGIGTDATRSAIIEGLFRREYIELVNKKDLKPTDKAMGLIDLIEQVAPELADPVLTALWEDELSQIEKGQLQLVQFERNLGEWLKKLVADIRSKAGTIKVSGGSGGSPHAAGMIPDAGKPTPTVECAVCGSPMRRLKGTKGFFWGCSAYQTGCRHTMDDRDGEPVAKQPRAVALPDAEAVAFPCPKCQKPLRRINGPRGPFWGCTGYPDCTHTLPDEEGRPGLRVQDAQGRTAKRDMPAPRPAPKTARAGESCPDCGKGLLVNKTMRDSGKPFVGCNHFPECRFFAWPAKG